MKYFITVLILLCMISRGSTQVNNHVYILDSYWKDGVGSLTVIAFEKDSIYGEYDWYGNSKQVILKSFGSYYLIHDTIYCQSFTENASFEYIFSRVEKQNWIFINTKSIILGFARKELGRKQYPKWKSAFKRYRSQQADIKKAA